VVGSQETLLLMSSTSLVSRLVRRSALAAALWSLAALAPNAAWAQFGGGGFGGSAVGGVSIDGNGVVRTASIEERDELLAQLRQEVGSPEGALTEATDLRMISLRGLQEAIVRSQQSGQPLPDEVKFLAGLQRIEYVFVYPEKNDIVIAGPAEPWTVRDDATVVGKQSGKPAMYLDDLIVTLRSVFADQHDGMFCSIEPTAEGHQRYDALMKQFAAENPGGDPRTIEELIREAVGPQTVRLGGVPLDSHFARVMLAADCQMKRIAMGMEESPVGGLPSYLAMADGVHSKNAQPRWWMASNYDALVRSEDRMAWKLQGQGVKTLTEMDAIDAQGNAKQTGKSDPTAKKWADKMTSKFDGLSGATPVFGELRNLMDLSVVAALIHQEQLAQVADCNLDVLLGRSSDLQPHRFEAPEAIDTQCTFINTSRGVTVSASGGVEINPYQTVQTQVVDEKLADVHQKADASGQSDSDRQWWWNG
jgi:hypothetical protein